MSDDYYAEVLDNLPFAKSVELLAQTLPRWLASDVATCVWSMF